VPIPLKIIYVSRKRVMTLAENRKRKEFSEVFSENYEIVFCAVYSRIGNEFDANDICQEVFIRLYQKFDRVTNVRKWLFNALKFVVKEYYKKKYRQDVNIDEVFNDIGMTFINGFRDTRIIIQDVIENMDIFKSDTERAIFELIAINRFSYRYVAEQYGLTRRQVEYKYTQLVENIIKYLKTKGINNLEDLL
jgi:RNA polymerase sigma factor (sigma-70 family)